MRDIYLLEENQVQNQGCVSLGAKKTELVPSLIGHQYTKFDTEQLTSDAKHARFRSRVQLQKISELRREALEVMNRAAGLIAVYATFLYVIMISGFNGHSIMEIARQSHHLYYYCMVHGSQKSATMKSYNVHRDRYEEYSGVGAYESMIVQ